MDPRDLPGGGPAFPPMHDLDTHASGMTLRDYFAAKSIPIMWDAYDKGYCGLNGKDEPNIKTIADGANSFSQKKTSAFIGVSARTGGRRKPYRVQVKIDGRNKCLGHYETEAEAAHAYDAHASRMYGHLAILNFPVKAE